MLLSDLQLVNGEMSQFSLILFGLSALFLESFLEEVHFVVQNFKFARVDA